MRKKSIKHADAEESRELMTRAQLMAYLQISHGTLDKLMHQKGLPYTRLGKKVLFFKSDIVAYLRSKQVKRPSSQKSRD